MLVPKVKTVKYNDERVLQQLRANNTYEVKIIKK